jgi:dipeptidyl aminopeptidase/acylaminoacyl peptidase
MNEEKVFWMSDGLKIQGEVYCPADRSRRYPALVICHGIPAKIKAPDDRGYPFLAEHFSREGFFVLIFNFRGAGQSAGNFDLLGWARDLDRGLDYFVLRPEVDQKRIFLMGFSGGAAVSIYITAQRKEIAGLVACASPAEFQDLFTGKGLEDFLVHARDVGIIKDPDFPASTEQWKNGFRAVRPLDWIGRIPPRPLLIIHGTQDDVVDASHARNLHAQVRGKAEFFLIEGAGHRLREDQRAMKKALDWLRKEAFSGQPSTNSSQQPAINSQEKPKKD